MNQATGFERRPLLFLDVDGPLNPFAAKPTRRPEGYETHRLTPQRWMEAQREQLSAEGRPLKRAKPLRVWLNPAHGPALLDLPVELVWATTWEQEANEWIGPILGLPELPVVRWPEKSARPEQERDGLFWKTAGARRAIPEALPLPSLLSSAMLVHDVLAEERSGYAMVSAVTEHELPAEAAGVRLTVTDGVLRVERAISWAAFPRTARRPALFTLAEGGICRWRANFRFSGYSSTWVYEQWTVHVAYGTDNRDVFTDRVLSRDVDDRVSLYGGRR